MPLIKCPGCGQNTSSMALTCPHCNTQIRGHIYQCRKCKTWVFNDKDICPQCGEAIPEESKHSGNERNNISSTSSSSFVRPDNLPRQRRLVTQAQNKKLKKRNGCIRAIIKWLLFVAMTGACAYVAYKFYARQLAEQEAMRQELTQRIAEDKQANARKLQLAQTDSAAWKQTMKIRTIEAAKQYIATYPEGIFIDEAYMLMEELQRRSVGPSEQKQIKGVVDNRLAQMRERFLKTGKRGIKDVVYNLPMENIIISKRHINKDSFVYIAHGNVEKIIIPTGKAKADTTLMELRMTLNNKKKIVESNLDSPEKK